MHSEFSEIERKKKKGSIRSQLEMETNWYLRS